MSKRTLKSATVKRQTTTGTTYKKTEFATVGSTILWHLKPLTVADWIILDNFWKEFLFTCNKLADIEEGDQVIIDWLTYTSKGVQVSRGVTFNTKKVLLNLS